MHDWFWSFWWLIFPLGGFAMGAFGMWMSYKRHRDAMEVMKTYAAQGKDPAEVARLMGLNPGGPAPNPGAPNPGVHDPFGPGAYWPGPGAGWGYGRGWRYWRRWSPYWQWRRCISLAAVSAGFGFASYYYHDEFGEGGHAFAMVAIITGILAVAAFLSAILSTVFASHADRNGG